MDSGNKCTCVIPLWDAMDRNLDCLKSLEEMNPGDTRLISEIGLCLMQLGR